MLLCGWLPPELPMTPGARYCWRPRWNKSRPKRARRVLCAARVPSTVVPEAPGEEVLLAVAVVPSASFDGYARAFRLGSPYGFLAAPLAEDVSDRS